LTITASANVDLPEPELPDTRIFVGLCFRFCIAVVPQSDRFVAIQFLRSLATAIQANDGRQGKQRLHAEPH